MKLTKCKHCGARVLPMTDGACPSCKTPLEGSPVVEPRQISVPSEDQEFEKVAPTLRPAGSGKLSWLKLAAVYALLLGSAIFLGTLFTIGADRGYTGNAVQMPLLAAIIASILCASGVGLLRRGNFARYVFLATAPWGSIALGSAFSQALWQDDIPYTVLAIFIYVPISFLLSRRSSLCKFDVRNTRWAGRGGALLLTCAAIMLLARLAVVASKPSGGRDALDIVISLNEYVQYLVLCDILLWNYIGALVAVSVPTHFRAKEVV